MLIYIVLFFIVLIPAITDRSYNVNDTKIALCITIILSIIAGLRDMIGGYDIYIYGAFFDSLSLKGLHNADWSNLLFEKGYTLYNYLIHLITDNRYIFFFITAVVSYMLIFKSLKLCNVLMFALFIFFCKYFLMSFVYVRQFLAMGIIWMSIRYIFEHKFIKFLFIVIVASSIHLSAIIFFPLYFICNHKYSRTVLSFVMTLSLIMGATALIKPLFQLVGAFTEIDKAFAYGNSAAGNINVYYLIESLFLGLGIVKYRDQLYTDKLSVCMTNIGFCYVCFSFLTMRDATILRLIWYFLIGFIYVIPNLCNCVRRVINIKPIVILYFTLLFFRLLVLWDGGDMMPYKTFMQNSDRNGRWEYMEYDNRYLIDKFYKW